MDVLIGKGKYQYQSKDEVVVYDESFEIRDKNDNRVYVENSDGSWYKLTHDINGETSYENETGYRQETLYNLNGELIYLKSSTRGVEIDTRKKEMTIEEIERLLGYEIKIVKEV